MATRLTKLELDEVSGVENPANEVHGFAVIKSMAAKLDPSEVDEVLKEVDRMEADFAVLYSALNSTEQYMGDAPEDVQAAASTLKQYVEGLFNDSDEPETPADQQPPANVAPVMASREKDGRTLLQRIFNKNKTTTQEETPVDKEHKEEAPITESTPKNEEKVTEPALDDKIVKALGEVAKGLESLEERLTKLEESDEAQREALGKSLDRLSTLETGSQAVSEYDITDVTVPADMAKATASDRGRAALKSVLVDVARHPGRREIIG